MTMNNKEILDNAEAFVAAHLRECCREHRELSDTAVLPYGRIREVEAMVTPVVGHHARVHALRTVELVAIRECADLTVVNERMDALTQDLRENHRLKWACDYAITHKFKEYHLLTNSVFTDTITEVAKAHGIVFTTINTY